MTIGKDELLIAEVQDKVLTLAHDPGLEGGDAETVQAIVDQYGEDAVLEFVRKTVRNQMSHREAGEKIFGDEATGAELGVVITRTIYGQSDDAR